MRNCYYMRIANIEYNKIGRYHAEELYNEKLTDLHSSPNITRLITWTGHVARMGKRRGVYRLLVGKPKGKRPLGGPRCRWKNNTRVGTLIVATIYLQLIQNRYMFRSCTVLQCSHQHCVQPVASDVEVVGYL